MVVGWNYRLESESEELTNCSAKCTILNNKKNNRDPNSIQWRQADLSRNKEMKLFKRNDTIFETVWKVWKSMNFWKVYLKSMNK